MIKVMLKYYLESVSQVKKMWLSLLFLFSFSLLSFAQTPVSNIPTWESMGPAMTIDQWLANRAQNLSSATASQQTALSSSSMPEAEVTPEIRAQAQALQNDPVRIFAYVRNQIRYTPYQGIWKGARATFLSRVGNDLDQCALLIALLHAADINTGNSLYSNARYIERLVLYPVSFVSALTGFAENLLKVHPGLQTFIPTGDNNGDLQTVSLIRFWVEVDINGTTYSLDPSFTNIAETTGLSITGLKNAMEYDETTFVVHALEGSTTTPGVDSIANVNQGNIVADLTEHSMNLIDHLKNNHANASIDEILGSRHIVAVSFSSLPTDIPFYTLKSLDFITHNTLPPKLYFKIKISHSAIINNPIEDYACNIAGKRLTLYHDETSGNAQIILDGQVLATGNTTTLDQDYTLTLSATFPVTTSPFSHSFTVKGRRTYAIAMDTGAACPGVLTQLSQGLTNALGDGASSTSEAIIGATLNLIAYNYIHQVGTMMQLMAGVTNTNFIFFSGGVVAQEKGYYVDFPLFQWCSAQKNGDNAKRNAWILASGNMFSAFEHGVLQQSQGIEHTAASTMKLIQINNAILNNKTFKVTSSNWLSIQSELNDSFPQSSKNLITDIVNGGRTVFLPQEGLLSLPGWDWQGHGYFAIGEDANGSINRIFAIIAGLFPISGGFSGTFGSVSPVETNTEIATNYWSPPPVQTPHPSSKDPVDLYTGDFLLDNLDISIGNAAPHGIALARHYNSGMSIADDRFGHGWKHSYNISATVHGDSESGMGLRQHTDAAALIAYSIIMMDFTDSNYEIDEFVISSIMTNWAMDQLIDNAVTIKLGNKSLKFIKLPDGTYNAPPGVTQSLVKVNGKFELHGRFGRVMTFNADNNIAAWNDADGNTMTFAYDVNQRLSQVKDKYNRSLTFHYDTNDHITSIDDSTGRTVSYQYSLVGDLTQFIDPENHAWTYAYDQNHRLVHIVDPLGQKTVENFYNDIGKVEQQKSATGHMYHLYIVGRHSIEEDPEGGQTLYEFDELGQQTALQDALGNRTTTVYDGQGHKTKRTDARGNATIFAYDTNHNLVKTTNVLGQQITNTYDASNHLVTTQDPLNNVIQFAYDTEHHLTTITDALGNIASNTYRLDGLLEKTIDRNGHITKYTYDIHGNVASIIRKESEVGGTVFMENYLYNSRGDREIVENANGHKTTLTYDKRRLPISEVDPIPSVTPYTLTNTYDDAGLLTSVNDKNGNVTTFSYSPNYQISSITLPPTGNPPISSTIQRIYDSRDNLLSITDPLGHITTNVYDAANRLIRIIDALGHQTEFVYDENSNTTTIRNHLGQETLFSYDALNRQISVTDGLGNTSARTYDESGRITLTKDANNKATEFTYNALGRQTAIKYSDNTSENFTYDNQGNLKTFANGEGNTYTFEYDAADRLVTRKNPLAASERYIYDDAGNLIQRTNPLGFDTNYNYDQVNNLKAINYGGGTIEISLNYDGNENLIQMTDTIGPTTYSYDALNQMVSTNDGYSNSVSYQYDQAGNRTKITYPGSNKSVIYVYDAADRLTNVTDWNNHTTNYVYDPANRLTQITYPNGITGNFTSDAVGQVAAFYYKKGVATPFVDRTITRNNLGFKLQENFLAGLEPIPTEFSLQEHRHNVADQLHQIMEQTVGNSVADNTNFFYDSNGNLLSGEDGRTIQYDTENRPTLYSFNGTTLTYKYDGLGNRIYREENGTQRRHVIDRAGGLPNVIMETNTANAAQQYYVWGLGLIATIDANGTTTHFFHADDLGSTIALTDTNGNVTDQFSYSPYGESFTRTGTTEIPYQWLGALGIYAEGNSLYHMKARFYDSKIKRFITKDPIGLDGGFNLYAYASGNPVFFFDPTGLSPEHGSGFGAGLQTAGEIGASFIPGVGEGLDIAIIIDPNSSILAKTLAAASLGVSVFTAGGSPNAGAFIRGADRLGDVSGSIKNVSGSIDDVANVARTQQHRVDTLSTHAQQRMATRGVSFDSVQEAVSRGTRNFNAQTGVATYYLPASVSSTGRAVRVVRNEATGNIITVIDKGSR